MADPKTVELEVKPDITCNFCQEAVNDPRAHVLWRRSSAGHPMIAVAHPDCDSSDVRTYYASWTHLSDLAESQEKMRRYFNAEIVEGQFTRKEVKDGLEQIYKSIPDAYFDFTEADYVDFMEGK